LSLNCFTRYFWLSYNLIFFFTFLTSVRWQMSSPAEVFQFFPLILQMIMLIHLKKKLYSANWVYIPIIVMTLHVELIIITQGFQLLAQGLFTV
jgi:hypothetical protein